MMDLKRLKPIERVVLEMVKQVKDPELGKFIGELDIIDEVKVDGDTAYITYHLTSPSYADEFALHIGNEIKKKAKEVEGVDKVIITLIDHVKAGELTKKLRAEK